MVKKCTFLLSLIFLFCLGVWQAHRYSYKENIINKIKLNIDGQPISIYTIDEIKKSEYKNISLKGRFLSTEPIYHYSLKKNTPGYEIILPFELLNSKEVVLVNTGWSPSKKPPRLHGNKLEITGFITKIPRKPLINFQNDQLNNLWFDLSEKDLSHHLNKNIPPVLLLLKDQKYLNGEKIDFDMSNITNNSLGYSITWFALALSLAFIGIYAHRQKS